MENDKKIENTEEQKPEIDANVQKVYDILTNEFKFTARINDKGRINIRFRGTPVNYEVIIGVINPKYIRFYAAPQCTYPISLSQNIRDKAIEISERVIWGKFIILDDNKNGVVFTDYEVVLPVDGINDKTVRCALDNISSWLSTAIPKFMALQTKN